MHELGPLYYLLTKNQIKSKDVLKLLMHFRDWVKDKDSISLLHNVLTSKSKSTISNSGQHNGEKQYS